MSNNLYEIKIPELSDANFGSSLKEQFENIDRNFKIISGSELLKGDTGDSARWIIFDLDSIFFKSETDSVYDLDSIFSDSDAASDIISNISTYYKVYYNICGGSFDEYRIMCLKFLFGSNYDSIKSISDISSESIAGCVFNNFSEDELKPVKINTIYYYAFWIANWWIAYNNDITDSDTSESATKIFNNNIPMFRPGCLIVACNIREDGSLEPVSSNPYPVLDLRFRNNSISGDMSDYEDIFIDLIDSSGSVVGTINNDTEDYLIFTYVVNLFNIYFNSDIGNFCWVLNGQQTNLIVQADTDTLLSTVNSYINDMNSIITKLQNIDDDISELTENMDNIEDKIIITSSDSTIKVTSTDSGTDLAVNIDNETIIKNNNNELSVDDSALTQYTGQKAISVSEKSDNAKTISLVIDPESDTYSTDSGDEEYYLSQSDSGLLLSGINKAIESFNGIDISAGEAITVSDSEEDTNTKIINVNYDNTTIGLNENTNELYVINALSDSEKSWIEDELFDTLFTVSISRSTSSFVFTGSDYTVTWTLTCKYDGTLVDLDSTPSGWTYSSTGTYTKTSTVTSSTSGSSVSSGSATCTYGGRSKTASSVSCTFVKYSYIYKTTEESLSSLDDIDFNNDATRMQTSTTNTIAGSYTIDFTDGQYAYFIISSTSSVSSITQLGLNYVNSGESMTRTNYGTYTVYRSTQKMSTSTQEVTVA